MQVRRSVTGVLPQKGPSVAGDAPETMYVLLSDELAAGRVVAELGSFVRFSRRMDKQLSRLERRTLKKYPHLLQRAVFGRPQRQA